MAPFLTREWGAEAVAAMREIKHLIDPDGVLNPGVLLSDDPQAHVTHIKRTPIIGDDAVDRCVECGFCEALCPSRAFTLTPRHRVVGNRIALESDETGEADRAHAIRAEYAHDGTDTCVADGMCSTAVPRGSTSPISPTISGLRCTERLSKGSWISLPGVSPSSRPFSGVGSVSVAPWTTSWAKKRCPGRRRPYGG
jgi:ferredoxin